MSSTASKPLLWALVDCNCFYCSCERLFRPDLEGAPVVVLSNNDGCLIALSPEAKALGYRMGEPYYQREKQLCRDKVAVFSSNYTLYGDISQRVMMTLQETCPQICQYSIDEAFIPFGPALAADAQQVGWLLHDQVKKWVGIPVRVGIGPTRTLAKLANKWAKKRSRVYQLTLGSPELEEVLDATPSSEIWGVGRQLSARLAALGIFNARQLRDFDPVEAKKKFTVVLQRTVEELRGLQCLTEELPIARKSMISSRSFGQPIVEQGQLAQALSLHCSLAGERLRREGLEAQILSVWFENSRHIKDAYCRLSSQINLPKPSNDTGELIKVALEALKRCYREGPLFVKGGIMLHELTKAGMGQASLWEHSNPASDQRAALMTALDKVNERYGRNTLRFMAQGSDQASWMMRRGKMSAQYTTRFADLPVVK